MNLFPESNEKPTPVSVTDALLTLHTARHAAELAILACLTLRGCTVFVSNYNVTILAPFGSPIADAVIETPAPLLRWIEAAELDVLREEDERDGVEPICFHLEIPAAFVRSELECAA